MNFYGYIGTIISSIIGYFLGSFSWSLFIGKTFFSIDIRKYYSHNAGAANFSRVFGKKWGFVITFLDMLKVTFIMLIALIISCIKINNINFGSTSYYIPVFFVLIGHGWPIYYNFKGGKMVSSFFGLLLMINPYYILIALGIWWMSFFIWKKISLSSIISVFIITLICWIPQLSNYENINFNFTICINTNWIWFNKLHNINFDNYYDSIGLINIVLNLSSILLIIKHKKNIKRLITKNEKNYW